MWRLLLIVAALSLACDRIDSGSGSSSGSAFYSCTVIGAGTCLEFDRPPDDICRAYSHGPCSHQGVGCRIAPDMVEWYYNEADASPPGPAGPPSDCDRVPN